MTRLLLISSLLTLALCANIGNFPTQSQDDYIYADRLGIAHISSATKITAPERYAQALGLGAGWNRWPLYWDRIETAPRNFNWAAYDRQVQADLQHGLNINAILLGIPAHHQDETSNNQITGLYAPIFADGSDFAAPGKAINPANPWAAFVYESVNRYKPGGVLAQQGALPDGEGIRVWEVWNEPDHRDFWRGSIADYAQLLRVAYIVTKLADPEAQVMFGGLLYPTENNWLAQVLSIYSTDPQREANNWFMDIVAIHNYINPWRSGWLTLYVRDTLRYYDLERPIWLNETGVPAWDDYPGPIWESSSPGRADSVQQAWFLIQSATYAWAYGADKVFYHQLYDDCGDQPAGTTFPPHRGELCTAGVLCSGDAYGIYRNTADSVCFNQHAYGGTSRPVASAFRFLAQIFGTEYFDSGERQFIQDEVVSLTFTRPRTDERITIMWNQTFSPVTFQYAAIGENAQIVALDGHRLIEPDGRGNYSINLPPARPHNHPVTQLNADAAIGGPPYVLIERNAAPIFPVQYNFADPSQPREPAVVVEINGMVTPVPTATTAPTLAPPPNLADADDTQPPTAQVNPLPEVSPITFDVSWHGEDDTGIDYYLIWVRVNEGAWLPWVETPLTTMQYTGEAGNRYEFAAWAVDFAGNWSQGTDLQAQASTRVE